jgi:hypothetical protein
MLENPRSGLTVSFLEYDLGYFDRDQDRVEPGPNPFAPDTVLTMCRNEMQTV